MNYCTICKVKKWFADMFDIHLCKEDCPYYGKDKCEEVNNNQKD